MADPDSSPAPHLAYGADAEALVAARYERAGYTIVDRNWRANGGELDVVASRRGEVVFVEVKARRREGIDSPAVAVTPAKQRKLRATAVRWLAAHPQHRGAAVRFDVVAVTGAGEAAVVDVFPAAF